MKIARSALDEIVRHAVDGYPYEICGIMIGPAGAGEVTEVRAVDNVVADDEQRRTRYRLDDRQHIRVQREADDRGFEIVGYYHSHPDHGAYFSKTDERDSLRGVVYVVVSTRERAVDAVKAFVPVDDHGPVREEPLEVVP